MQTIAPFLWFDTQAEEAANFYVSIFKNSKITRVARKPASAPGPEGVAMVVSFVLDGQAFNALNGGPMFKFTEAVSFVANCDGQAEVDRLWDALTADGGSPSRCGWLKDKYGLSWQIVPKQWQEMMTGDEPEKANRAMAAIMTMGKLDLAAIEAAYNG